MNPESSSEQSKTTADKHQGGEHNQRRMYLLFGAMILTSTTVMFLLTYTNVFSIDHVRWSEERFYMALLMGSAMAIIMLSFMWAMMYRNVKVNIAIILVALVLGGAGLGLSRSQALVGDVAYMDGMIPHHSIAILTSGRANLDDVRVRELADGIIDAQEKEIAEMNWLVDDIAANGKATTQEEADQRPVPDFSSAR
ncbi:DUF305 domain-containing protein [Salinibacterium sp. G-O1]|uniref:DUF305 domain-containing protein n=1 Tax=Salinibacterium sp. G-O1 TaxID=3046208 RepID=UPI0024B8925E|nr:DUF305 domain-containing protein [Salinibacterium sp. G-O1]MDJ0336145.1 DUF305 domain-containing protein [Salinibacterium sp. G-O1]